MSCTKRKLPCAQTYCCSCSIQCIAWFASLSTGICATSPLKIPTLPAAYGAPYTGEDKARDRERVREKHLKRRLKDKDKEEDGAGRAPTLGGSSSDSEPGSGGDSDSSDDANNSDDHDDGRSDSSGDMSDNDSDDGSGAESSDEEDIAPIAAGTKRGRTPSKRSLEEQEEEVLAMLAARK